MKARRNLPSLRLYSKSRVCDFKYKTRVEVNNNNNAASLPIEIGLEHAPFVALVYFFPHLNKKTADYGPQQH
jgi:hypothetical protein